MRNRLKMMMTVFLVLLAGCGDSGGIGQKASSALMPYVAAVRDASRAGDRPAAVQKLGELKATAAQLNQRGDLTGDKLTRVNSLIAEVERFVIALPAPQTAPAPPAPLEFPSGAVQGSQSQSQPGAAQRGRSGEQGGKGEKGKDGEEGGD